MKKEKSKKIVAILTAISALVAFSCAFFGFLLPLLLEHKCNADTKNADSIEIIYNADESKRCLRDKIKRVLDKLGKK